MTLLQVLARCALALIAAGVMKPSWASPPVLPHDSPHKSVGTVSCASSMCHGSVTPWQESHVLRNEYVTWQRLDRHTNAWRILQLPNSVAMARKLGLAEGADKAKVCLDCHGHNPAAALRGPRFDPTDGVSCEGCHGPAEKWLATHVQPGATHARNIADGLYPTSEPVAMARLCISCHFGNESKLVTHRMMGAGHPRLGFDLETFASIQPPHYVIDDDWRRRKGSFDGVRIWAIGQALMVRQQLDVLTSPIQGREGLFPELVLFDCHACHRPMADKRWQPRQGLSPGRVRLNESSLLMLRNLTRVVSPLQADAISVQITQLHRAVTGDTVGRPADALSEARKLAALVDEQVTRFARHSFSRADLQALFREVVREGLRTGHQDYAGAEQTYLAMKSIAAHLQKQGALPQASAMNEVFTRMRGLLREDEKYAHRAFRDELQHMESLVNVWAAAPR